MQYVGLSKKLTIRDRYRGEWSTRSHNYYLKNAVNFYGKDSFEETIIEERVPNVDWLNNLETYYIKKLNTMYPNGYNFTDGGLCSRIVSQETRRKLSEANQKRYTLIDYQGNKIEIENLKKFCEINRLSYSAMLNMVSKLNYCSQGYGLFGCDISKIENPNKEYHIKNCYGETYKLFDNQVNEFCRRKHFNKNRFRSVLRGDSYYYKGWCLSITVIPDTCKIKYNNMKFIDPNGNTVIIDNIYQYCKNHGLRRDTFYHLVNKKRIVSNGWRLAENRDISDEQIKNNRISKYGKFYEITCPDGKTVQIQNLNKFCRDNNLQSGNMYLLVLGKILVYNGYHLPHTDLSKYKKPTQYTYIALTNDNGEIISAENPPLLVAKYPVMTKQSVYELIKKKRESVKGWRLLEVKKEE